MIAALLAGGLSENTINSLDEDTLMAFYVALGEADGRRQYDFERGGWRERE